MNVCVFVIGISALWMLSVCISVRKECYALLFKVQNGGCACRAVRVSACSS